MGVGTLALFGEVFSKVLTNYLAQMGGIILGVICYLIEPGMTLYALSIVILLDLFSRLVAESHQHGGFYQAAKNGHISSDKMLKGTAIKIIAYFCVCAVAAQSKYVFGYEAAAELFGNIIYSILFLVECWSMLENFEEAGIQGFGWLKLFTRKKLEDLAGGQLEEPMCSKDEGGGEESGL